MAKDQKGHGSEKKLLGKTGRTEKEYTEHLKMSGSPETLSRKLASGVLTKHEHAKAMKINGYSAVAGKVQSGTPSVDPHKKRPARGRDPKTHQLLKKGE